ncbi:hypothetical protein TNCV_1448861 [Trichonephila clavipes]|nr:hypothetical protein TNCV_1448861 [Trichonephila clavipes]
MFGAEIIAVVSFNDKIVENDEESLTLNISYKLLKYHIVREGQKAVETILQYFEQQAASIMDSLCLRHLRDEATTQSTKRKTTGHFTFL